MSTRTRHNEAMGETFTFIVVGAVALFALVGVVSWLTGGSVYDQIGESGFGAAPGHTGGGRAQPGGRSAVGAAPAGLPDPHSEREQEIRQMLQARSDRRVRRGEPPLDIDAELARLTEGDGLSSSATPGGGPSRGDERGGSGGHDAALTEEVRQLAVARNERRARRGEPPLDIEAEVQRTLDELDPS